MKKLISLILLPALLFTLAVAAFADAIVMPRDGFLNKHWNECSYEDRAYYANGPEGYVLAHRSPDSAEATPLPNGGKYRITYTYGGEWGLLEYDPDTLEAAPWDGASGWVRLSDMTADYDSDAFFSDHRGEIVSDGDALLELDPEKTLYLYKYPGSGEVTDEIPGGWGGDAISFSTLFTDPAGRQWGYCNYYYGHRDFWVCLDDPYNGELAPDENAVTIVIRGAPEPTPEPVPTAAPTLEPKETAAQTETPAPTEAPAPPETPPQRDAPTETPAPSEAPAPAGKVVELTPPADRATLEQAAKANRGYGPWRIAGCVAAVLIAAAVLVAALRKKRK